jgi:hypothetical protein
MTGGDSGDGWGRLQKNSPIESLHWGFLFGPSPSVPTVPTGRDSPLSPCDNLPLTYLTFAAFALIYTFRRDLARRDASAEISNILHPSCCGIACATRSPVEIF